MNKENMLVWANILDSGKYNQYQGGWGGSTYSGYCCLNVALVEFTGEEYDDLSDDHSTKLEDIFGWDKGIQAKDFFTTDEFNRILPGDQEIQDMENHFVTCNDTLKMTFPEIATKIREFVAKS